MQGAEEENSSKSRSDEELLNHRPSPNFKHKKYLRSKFEEAMMVEANSTSTCHNKLEKVNKVVEAQPPLPPNPPPPDTPPMITNVKQEVEDDEYTCSTTETSSDLEHLEEIKTAATIKVDHSEEKPGVTMCRNFARGTCKKGTACIFAHELILSQLPGVYTFCRNFQNSVCSFPKCKFVHATVFEKEHFFRTGYLPPHALAHLKEASVQQAPPPLPQPEDATAGLPPVYSNATPNPALPCVPPTVVQYNGEPVSQPSDPNIFSPLLSGTDAITSPKRAWSEIDEVNSSTGVLDSGEPLAKKCKKCHSTELREQLIKAQVETVVRHNKEIANKIEVLNKKNEVRASLIQAFYSTDGLRLTGDKELSLLSPNSKNDWTSMLHQILRKMESGMPPDAS
ncbi:hypothetical protein PYW07_000213 [Mythimna separata]|uniref:C3H1-type domain-containing protein n=1 Tax=Mythimna separata TaxID=271217 RepID=A0AAD7Z2K5_MYTSE|nr:hypothetical protein PYW07_000213 [Mythimna separata]